VRICLVTDTWPPDINGVAHTLAQLADALRQRGVALQLIRPRPADADAPRTAGMQAELRVVGVSLPGYRQVRLGLPATATIQRLWREQRPTAVYLATQGPLGWSALRAAKRLGIPVVSGWHTHFNHYCHAYGLGWLAPVVMRRLCHFHNRTAATLVPTGAQAEALAGQGVRNTRVMGRGIDGVRFSPCRRDPALRAAWGSDAHRPVALYVGRLAAEKNLALLRDTFTTMMAARPDIALVVVGDGPGRAALQRALPQAHFTGFVEATQLAAVYASADLFLFPSVSETWGNVVLEAMASGLAVVAFRHAAAATLIDDGVNGISLPLGDEAGFQEAAVTLCQQPSRCARLGRAARTRALMYRWDAIADIFLAALSTAREPHDDASAACHV